MADCSSETEALAESCSEGVPASEADTVPELPRETDGAAGVFVAARSDRDAGAVMLPLLHAVEEGSSGDNVASKEAVVGGVPVPGNGVALAGALEEGRVLPLCEEQEVGEGEG